MNPWLETLGVILVTISGFFLGRAFSCLRKPYWFIGWVFSFALVAILLLARQPSLRGGPQSGWGETGLRSGVLQFIWPFSWIVMCRAKFVILSLATTIGLTTPMSRLPYKFEKALVYIAMAAIIGWFSVMPFLSPALIRQELSNLPTRFDSQGVCRQQTSYTCGPAAAVTALNRLGLSASEGEIAILAHCSPAAGTLPGCLVTALHNRYGAQGLRCQYHSFKSLSQLKSSGIILAVVKDAFLLDHCVAILEVRDNAVVIADPVTGIRTVDYDQFEKNWQFSGIVLYRDPA